MIIQRFKNRKKELSELAEVLNSKSFEFLVIYGRRRIGKTELILKATENKKRIYYLAVGRKNLERFYSVCANKYPEVSKLKMDWEVLFEFLKDKAEVVVIDEFQNMIHEDRNILNIFQAIADIILKDSKLKLIVLGSSVSIITSKVLSYKSPLYGRRTGSIELKPISFFDIADFFPKASIKELIEIYGFADGIPFYLIKIDKYFWSWLENELRKEKTFLRDEVDFLMRYEFEDVSTYKLILEAIAYGKTKIGEIKDFIKAKRTDITPYLRNLLEIGMIRRIVPVTENIKTRAGRYYLSDNFLKFWFRYIYPNISSIEEGAFSIDDIKKNYSEYLGFVFEDVVMQFLIEKREKIFKFAKLGRWWHKDKEIDLVGFNNNKEILFCECKWKDKVNAEKVLEELREKAKHVQWNRKKEYFAIFAKSFRKRIKEPNLFLFDLKDMEKMMK